MDRSSRSTQSGSPRTQSGLACNICLRRMPNSPVAAYCGHVFCWPCLYRSWSEQGPAVQAGPAITKSCPICGTHLREGYNIVPIYGFDNVASPRSGTERPTTTTGPTTAAAAPGSATSSRPTAAAAAPDSNTPIPPRPTAAAFFTATPRHPHSLAARAAAALNTAFPPRPTAVSAGTDIPPRPNPPARITQTQTQTDTARAPPARPLGPNRLRRLRNLASTIPRHDTLGELLYPGTRDRLRPASSAARTDGLGVASRSLRRRRNLRLINHLRLNPRSMDGNRGNSIASQRARMDVLNEILDAIRATLAEIAEMDALLDELENDLGRP